MADPARWTVFRGVAVLALVTALGCETGPSEAPRLWSGPLAPGERTFEAVEWTLEWELGDDPSLLLASPRHLTSLDSLVVWWDDFDHQVFAVGADGALRWTFGREGKGPDEFSSMGDLAVDATGNILALDSDNGRLTRISPMGERLELMPLPEGYWRSLAPQPDGAIVLAGVDGEQPFALLGPGGSLQARFGIPWEGFAELALIQRQGRLVDHRDGRWAYAFIVGNGWFPYRGSEPMGYIGQNIEHTDFPEMVVVATRNSRVSRLAERPSCSSCAGWMSGDTLSVLFGGYGEHANRLVDRYALSDGAYLGSLLLPTPAVDVIAAAELTVVLDAGMEPRLRAYSRQSTAAGGGEGATNR